MSDSHNKKIGRPEKFAGVIEELPSEKSVKIIITQVDPDAIGAGLGLAFILDKKFGRDTEIFYCGSFSHPQNRYLFNKYNLSSRMRPISELDSTEGIFALVDSHEKDDQRLPQGVDISNLSIVIDHHREESSIKEGSDKFIWIDGEVGSACTLIVELIRAFELKIDDDFGEKIATMIALGIFEDTRRLIVAGSRDTSAYEYISNFASRSELTELMKYKLPASYFHRLMFALERMEISSSRLVTGVGGVVENPDDVSTVADYLLRMEGITLVVIWVIVGDVVRISARNDNPSLSLDTFIRERFGAGGADITDGQGKGGVTMDLKLGNWMSPETRDLIYQMVQTRLKEIVFADD